MRKAIAQRFKEGIEDRRSDLVCLWTHGVVVLRGVVAFVERVGWRATLESLNRADRGLRWRSVPRTVYRRDLSRLDLLDGDLVLSGKPRSEPETNLALKVPNGTDSRHQATTFPIFFRSSR